jgi:hypothetical protein
MPKPIGTLVAININKANATRLVGGEDTVVMEVRSIMSGRCLCAIVKMRIGTTKIMVENGWIGKEGHQKEDFVKDN